MEQPKGQSIISTGEMKLHLQYDSHNVDHEQSDIWFQPCQKDIDQPQ